MKYIFPCTEANWQSKLDDRFGRATGYAVYDDGSKDMHFVENIHKDGGHGVGIKAAQMVINEGADVVLASGPIGPKAMEILEAAQLKIHTDLGNVTLEEAFNKIAKQ